MSEDAFDLDRAVMEYLREDYGRHGSRMVPVQVIAQALEQRHRRDVLAEDVAAEALRTRYAQRAADGSVTGISPYGFGFRLDPRAPHSVQLMADAYERRASYGY
ncbi:hypothetical protein [Lysobacter silvisoli]|uniref:Uncharacterized protein n=1 Tax=Lysobacter silvisoli TaxID=2293254 RepID=A0A371K6T4_9GAMM|nr:hypothetical protein [Lysobacter silvisoli]RDZ29578.1 hypothetical protein DX914_11055 [Lysobacter silvisoli]